MRIRNNKKRTQMTMMMTWWQEEEDTNDNDDDLMRRRRRRRKDTNDNNDELMRRRRRCKWQWCWIEEKKKRMEEKNMPTWWIDEEKKRMEEKNMVNWWWEEEKEKKRVEENILQLNYHQIGRSPHATSLSGWEGASLISELPGTESSSLERLHNWMSLPLQVVPCARGAD